MERLPPPQRGLTRDIQRREREGERETERKGPFTTGAINRQLKRIAKDAGFPDGHVYFHMLWHACSYVLANAGHDTRAIQDWLGHRSIQHTVRYTELSDPSDPV
jgi:site-specific recombinase XerD